MSHIVFDQKYQSVIRELHCVVCDVVIATLAPLDIVCDQTIDTVDGKTVITIRQLSALAYLDTYGGTRTFTVAGDYETTVPVCRTCVGAALSYEQTARVFDQLASASDQLADRRLSSRMDSEIFRERARYVRAIANIQRRGGTELSDTRGGDNGSQGNEVLPSN